MIGHRNIVPDVCKTSGKVLFNGKTLGAPAQRFYLPGRYDTVYIITVGSFAVATGCDIIMGIANNASGSGAVVLPGNVPVYYQDVRQSDSYNRNIYGTGVHTLVFCIPAILVPYGKYVGVYHGTGHVSNVITSIAYEDTYIND